MSLFIESLTYTLPKSPRRPEKTLEYHLVVSTSIGTACNLGAFNDNPTKNLVCTALGFFLTSKMINQQHCQVWVLQISIYRPGSGQYAMNCNDMTNTMSSLSSVLCQSLAGTVEVMFSHDLIRESAGAVFANRVARRLLQSSTLGYHRISVFFVKQYAGDQMYIPKCAYNFSC